MQVPTVALCPGTYGDPKRVGVSYERGTPVIPELYAVLAITGLCEGGVQLVPSIYDPTP